MKPWDIKRFLETHAGDPEFREVMGRDPRVAVRHWNLEVDPEPLLPLLKQDSECEIDGEAQHPAVRRFREWVEGENASARQLFLKADAGRGAYREWRLRQRNRLLSEMPVAQRNNPHLPYHIELSSGCSIGCGYCALATRSLRAVATLSAETEQLFSEVLRVLADFFGEAAETGILYGATEPFDNPDYESYLSLFHDQFGLTPRTTSAAWHRDIKRTGRLLEQCRRWNGSFNRLSVNSLDQFRLCMEAFTAEELAGVELVLHYPEANPILCAAGRGRVASPKAEPGTIACVSGFAINIAERSVQLVSPCTDLERWPLGFVVYRRAHFRDADELAEFITDCEREVFRGHFDDNSVPRFRHDLHIASTAPFTLTNEYVRHTFEGEVEKAVLRAVDGHRTVGDIVDELANAYDATILYYCMERLHQAGLFERFPSMIAAKPSSPSHSGSREN